MAWDHLSVNKPHLVYIILGGFTTLFMLCSSVIKERLYIGEATVATLCGIIFGPHAAALIDPGTWGNTDQITLEFSRIVLVVQCFAVGVELPKAYMERHWRSVVFLLVPVMTFGWLVTSLFIWAVFHQTANWLDCLCIAACVTATDPVLASSVVGKGKFAKRVPKHLRDLLSAESGCNDGMAFPFIYLALYIIDFRREPNEVALHWFVITILYECIFGAFYGVCVGYAARRLIRFAHEREYIDRESFLVFYFVLALFCAGSGSILGMDDLLIGFACGVGFSNDGWFVEKTEESHVSNVIDLLINLAFFVYFGTIIPWAQYNDGVLGLSVWKLIVIAILVLFFRRIPIMMALKPLIPDIKTWREALFAGHFGPIGVGAIFVAILARAELETGGATPLASVPTPPSPHANIIDLIWPITTFLVLTSIIVHGSSIAVFTLGKHINTLTLTMSYTQANEQGPHWMDRLPRIQSRSKSSMSLQRSDLSFDDKDAISYPPGMLPPIGSPRSFLRRQKEEDNPSRVQSRSSSKHRSRRTKSWDAGRGPGGPVSQSAIAPRPRPKSPSPDELANSRSDSDTLAMKSENTPSSDEEKQGRRHREEDDGEDEEADPGEIFEEGKETVYEDDDGNVLAVQESHEEGAEREEKELKEGRRLMSQEGADENDGVAPTKVDPDHETADTLMEKIESAGESIGTKKDTSTERPERPGRRWREGVNKLSTMRSIRKAQGDSKAAEKPKPEPTRARGPARAYQYGNTIVIEDEDGEVIKKYDIPAPEKKQQQQGGGADQKVARHRIGQMGKMLGLGGKAGKVETGAPGPSEDSSSAAGPNDKKASPQRSSQEDDDKDLRFTISTGGRRMSKAEFIGKIQEMDPKRRAQVVEDSNAPEAVKQEARKETREHAQLLSRRTTNSDEPSSSSADQRSVPVIPEEPSQRHHSSTPAIFARPSSHRSSTSSASASSNLQLVDSNNAEIPIHNVSRDLRRHHRNSAAGGASGGGGGETAAERRRRQAALQRPAPEAEEDSEDDGTDRVPPRAPSDLVRRVHELSSGEGGETAAERRRREGALGIRSNGGSDESDEEEEEEGSGRGRDTAAVPSSPFKGSIRFADLAGPARRSHGRDGETGSRPSALKWGKNIGR